MKKTFLLSKPAILLTSVATSYLIYKAFQAVFSNSGDTGMDAAPSVKPTPPRPHLPPDTWASVQNFETK